MIIRHGEKLGDSSSDKDGGPNLSMRGSARAAALPQLFAPAQPPYGCILSIGKDQKFAGDYASVPSQGTAPRFSTPDFLFATQASKSSNRPVETITPLSAALNLTYDDKHADDDYAQSRQQHSHGFEVRGEGGSGVLASRQYSEPGDGAGRAESAGVAGFGIRPRLGNFVFERNGLAGE